MYCSHCGTQVGAGAQFCSKCGAPMAMTGNPFKDGMRHVVRPLADRKIAGVCAGFAQAYGWDVTVVRLVALLLVFCGVGGGALAYVIAWIVIPNEVAGTKTYPVTPPPTSEI
jgi:phage shock protein C